MTVCKVVWPSAVMVCRLLRLVRASARHPLYMALSDRFDSPWCIRWLKLLCNVLRLLFPMFTVGFRFVDLGLNAWATIAIRTFTFLFIEPRNCF